MFDGRKDPQWVPAEEWFEKNLANVIPEATENDRTAECVDEAFIQRFQNRQKPSLVDPKTMHVLECSYCMRRVMLARQAGPKQSEPNWILKRPARLGWLIAASVSILAAGGFLAYEVSKPRHAIVEMAQSSPVDATVDLFDAVTARGVGDQASPLDQVILPAASIHLSIILPQFSDPGGYSILVAMDQAGEHVVARAAGTTLERSGKQILAVDLNLRSVQPGAYFLSTVRGSDQGVYYYPLQVRALTKKGS